MNKSIAALPTILIITFILVEISTVLALLNYHLGWIENQNSMMEKTLYLAEAGIYDTLPRIERNLNFTCSSSTINFDNNQQAEISVLGDTPSSGKDTIISIGKYKNLKRKIEVIIEIDQTTGKVNILSWKEKEI